MTFQNACKILLEKKEKIYRKGKTLLFSYSFDLIVFKVKSTIQGNFEASIMDKHN